MRAWAGAQRCPTKPHPSREAVGEGAGADSARCHCQGAAEPGAAPAQPCHPTGDAPAQPGWPARKTSQREVNLLSHRTQAAERFCQGSWAHCLCHMEDVCSSPSTSQPSTEHPRRGRQGSGAARAAGKAANPGTQGSCQAGGWAVFSRKDSCHS